MPAPNPKPPKLQCPFCSTISTRGTGLSAHVRAKHPREYGKWNKNPNRLHEAAATAAVSEQAPTTERRMRAAGSAARVEVAEAPSKPNREDPIRLAAPTPQTGDNNADEALALLQQAYEQLSVRKQTIESELARIEALRSEHEEVTTQVAALDVAMKTFQHQPKTT